MTPPDDAQNERIDAALANWRQGDCVLEGELWFARRTADATLEEEEVPGLVVLSQSCDVVRRYKDRPNVAVSPLAQVDDSELLRIAKGYRPQFVAIPGVAARKLVADLDRVMTVDKQIVAAWPRTQGCSNDAEVRSFARAVARKHSRFAFPDDFNRFMGDLQNRIKDKHGRQSDEGDSLRALSEIRVRAAPSWDAQEVELMFWFIAYAENAPDLRRSGILKVWEARIAPSGRFKRVLSQITTHEELTAQDYLESDQLDLDHLSV